MQVNFDKNLLDLDGKKIYENDKELKLSALVISSLLGNSKNYENYSAVEKMNCYDVAIRINKEKALDLSVEEISFVKKALLERKPPFLPLLLGQSLKMIEGQETGLEQVDSDE
jgi:hypothetical protein